MEIEFVQAKNGEQTFCINKSFYHSSYAPSKEAERFYNNVQIPYTPRLIFLIEPGLPYAKKILSQKFPDSKIIRIKILKTIQQDEYWDFSIDFNSSSKSERLFTDFFDEAMLLESIIITWPAAEKFFKNETDLIWTFYKKALENAKTILVTRQFFERKWLYNTCKFFCRIQNTLIFNIINLPVLITASGPSLQNAIKIIKENSDKFFLIALSSSFSVLLKNKIKPDLVMTTDGGFWAGEHLKEIIRNYNDIPIALSSEAYIPNKAFENPIIPLNYDEGLSTEIFKASGIQYLNAKRNGTVSGTALEFAENISTHEIFFCGLDLSISKGFQHTKPNELEKNNCLKDSRIKTPYTRLLKSEFSNSSLEIYLDWFCNHNFKNKTYRIIDNPQNHIDGMQEISTFEFTEILNRIPINNKNEKLQKNKNQIKEADKKILKQKIKDFVLKKIESEQWTQQIFPIDYVSISHAENKDKEKITELLEQKKSELKNRIRKLFDE